MSATLPASGANVSADSAASVQVATRHLLERSADAGPAPQALTWKFHIPLVNNVFMLWDIIRFTTLVIAVIEFFVLATGYIFDHQVLLMPLVFWGIIAAISVCSYFLVAALVFKNDWHVEFVLDSKGAICRGHLESGILFRLLIWLRLLLTMNLIFLALFLLSKRRGPDSDYDLSNTATIKWQEVRKVTVHRRLGVITLKSSWFYSMRLYCSTDLMDEVISRAEAGAAEAARWRAMHPAKPFAVTPGARRILLWTGMCGASTLASQAWETDATAFGAMVAGSLTWLAAILEGFWRRPVALSAVASTLLQLALLWDMAHRTTSFAGGYIVIYGYDRDTSLLIMAAAGSLALLAIGGHALLRGHGSPRGKGAPG